MITILIIAYFSINTYIACENWCDTKVEFAMYWLIGLPLVIVQLLWLFIKEWWWKFSNKTGASFYWGFYVTGRYKNLPDSELKLISRMAIDHKNPNVRKWAKKVQDANGGGGKETYGA